MSYRAFGMTNNEWWWRGTTHHWVSYQDNFQVLTPSSSVCSNHGSRDFLIVNEYGMTMYRTIRFFFALVFLTLWLPQSLIFFVLLKQSSFFFRLLLYLCRIYNIFHFFDFGSDLLSSQICYTDSRQFTTQKKCEIETKELWLCLTWRNKNVKVIPIRLFTTQFIVN